MRLSNKISVHISVSTANAIFPNSLSWLTALNSLAVKQRRCSSARNFLRYWLPLSRFIKIISPAFIVPFSYVIPCRISPNEDARMRRKPFPRNCHTDSTCQLHASFECHGVRDSPTVKISNQITLKQKTKLHRNVYHSVDLTIIIHRSFCLRSLHIFSELLSSRKCMCFIDLYILIWGHAVA
jgi:hypothetical protein